MSSHQEWETARARRDAVAVSVLRTITSGSTRDITKDIATFLREDAAMDRLEKELNANGQ